MFHFHGLRFRQEEGAGPNVNQTAGFTEALALAAGHELTDEERQSLEGVQDRDIASGLTTESQTPEPVVRETVAEPPDDQGAAPEPEEEEDPGTEQELSPLEKQLRDAQEFIGRQGQQLGEVRAEMEALKAAQAAPADEGTDEYYFPDGDTMDRLVERFDESGGQALLSYVANAEPENIPAAMALWKAGGDPDIAAAYLYEERVQALVNEGQAAQAAPALPESVQRLAQREEMRGVISGLVGGLSEEQRQAVAAHSEAAVQEAGPLTQKAINDAFASSDPADNKAAFDEVVRLSEARAATAKPAPVTKAEQDLRTKTKQAAAVNTGSRRAVSPRESGKGAELPTSKDDFEQLSPEEKRVVATKLVADQFAKTESTSVRDGLTYGTKP